MKLDEILSNEKAYYVGNCITDFGGDGYCSQDALPWRDTTDMGQALENPKMLTKKQFMEKVEVPVEIERQIGAHECEYGIAHGVFFILDLEDDVHYFFVN